MFGNKKYESVKSSSIDIQIIEKVPDINFLFWKQWNYFDLKWKKKCSCEKKIYIFTIWPILTRTKCKKKKDCAKSKQMWFNL